MKSDATSVEPTSESHRVTLRVPEEQIKQAGALVECGEYPNRSEVIRAALRQHLDEKDARKKLERHQSLDERGDE